MIKTLIAAFILLAAPLLYAVEELPAPYKDLKEILSFNHQGWFANAYPLSELLKERRAKIVIELGSWLGKSTRCIARNLSEDGVVYAVDHWKGSIEHQGPFKNMLPQLYEQFLSNMIRSKLAHKVVPMRMATLEAAKEFLEKHVVPDVVYIDASHDEESVYADIQTYFPLVQGHGVLCGDDWNYGEGQPVKRAVKRFAKENHLNLEVYNGAFWVLQE